MPGSWLGWVLPAALAGLLLGPWLAATTVRLATRQPAARPSAARAVLTSLASAAALGAGPALAGPRPAAIALAWFGGAAVVLTGVDGAVHRLPDRVTYPAVAVCAAVLLVDAVVTDSGPALLRAVVAALVALAAAAGARLGSPGGFGLGDVKLLGLLGLVLGWAGWGVLMAGVFVGFLLGALGSVLLMTVGRAGWRTAVPFGPPLLAGAYVALALAGPLPGA
ncbi:leader peptidase (prepilin peptidase) / N-methyltransferase [Modestobacter sp. DSM 44400]|uniref:prepilin peptidase n=1 Tax=Modestobacter sp. DSM 44400 TaxID=1550230 RepID=UPI000894F19C|nr:prepilin peptidase [Modestobacter sp. DSM 44400]SDX61563.1 leader peptidase (prepilin peptidase) / N-methyltransferase [Modestobacter sp. DSM 44400]